MVLSGKRVTISLDKMMESAYEEEKKEKTPYRCAKEKKGPAEYPSGPDFISGGICISGGNEDYEPGLVYQKVF